jgi:hypothetical protein
MFASPELLPADSGLVDEYQIRSSDENNFDPKMEAQAIQEMIANKVKLSALKFDPIPIISGINDPESIRNESRTCPYCGIFLIIFFMLLIFYGEGLKSRPDAREWFLFPMLLGIMTYLSHVYVHIQFASSIFLNYYWLLIFDILVFAYFYYSHFIIKPYKNMEFTIRTIAKGKN